MRPTPLPACERKNKSADRPKHACSCERNSLIHRVTRPRLPTVSAGKCSWGLTGCPAGCASGPALL